MVAVATKHAHCGTGLQNAPTEAEVLAALADLKDPEIPVLTLNDLGVVRWVRVGGGVVTVGVAPTYVGCPAVDVIETSILERLRESGYQKAAVERVWSPPWTTEWISERGREKLKAYGIAPPARLSRVRSTSKVACPRCGACETTRVSEFGSTPCKASYKCDECLEPFEYFKCL